MSLATLRLPFLGSGGGISSISAGSSPKSPPSKLDTARFRFGSAPADGVHEPAPSSSPRPVLKPTGSPLKTSAMASLSPRTQALVFDASEAGKSPRPRRTSFNLPDFQLAQDDAPASGAGRSPAPVQESSIPARSETAMSIRSEASAASGWSVRTDGSDAADTKDMSQALRTSRPVSRRRRERYVVYIIRFGVFQVLWLMWHADLFLLVKMSLGWPVILRDNCTIGYVFVFVSSDSRLLRTRTQRELEAYDAELQKLAIEVESEKVCRPSCCPIPATNNSFLP
jgi:hypothetical protein